MSGVSTGTKIIVLNFARYASRNNALIFPSAAPSIIPGISAVQIEKSLAAIPKF
jgi:hypothetical protein